MPEKKTQGEEIYKAYQKALNTDYQYVVLEIGCAIVTQLERMADIFQFFKEVIEEHEQD